MKLFKIAETLTPFFTVKIKQKTIRIEHSQLHFALSFLGSNLTYHSIILVESEIMIVFDR